MIARFTQLFDSVQAQDVLNQGTSSMLHAPAEAKAAGEAVEAVLQ